MDVGVGGRGIDHPLIVNLGNNQPTFRLNYVHELVDNIAREAT